MEDKTLDFYTNELKGLAEKYGMTVNELIDESGSSLFNTDDYCRINSLLMIIESFYRDNLQFTKIRDVKSPVRGTTGSAGLDLFTPNELDYTINPGESVLIPSGLKVLIPDNHVGYLKNKSSIACNGLILGACVIDNDYRGEILINLHNISNNPICIEKNKKITQLIIQSVNLDDASEITNEQYDRTPVTGRGQGGFGSTGS